MKAVLQYNNTTTKKTTHKPCRITTKKRSRLPWPGDETTGAARFPEITHDASLLPVWGSQLAGVDKPEPGTWGIERRTLRSVVKIYPVHYYYKALILRYAVYNIDATFEPLIKKKKSYWWQHALQNIDEQAKHMSLHLGHVSSQIFISLSPEQSLQPLVQYTLTIVRVIAQNTIHSFFSFSKDNIISYIVTKILLIFLITLDSIISDMVTCCQWITWISVIHIHQ